jgi:hypothetical protein
MPLRRRPGSTAAVVPVPLRHALAQHPTLAVLREGGYGDAPWNAAVGELDREPSCAAGALLERARDQVAALSGVIVPLLLS